ncbi:phosphoglycerate mutase [Rhizoctonia solani]|nr:phosphoglycerate mutase [Rhizoctonia solani]
MSEVSSLAKQVSYEAIPGFFIQSDRTTAPQAHPPVFGLKSRTSPMYWNDFETRIKDLQKSAPKGVRYVVCWLARHGQGWHNVAVDKHGLPKWESHFSKLNGDGEITWGPIRCSFIDSRSFIADAKLTPLGETQATEVNALWKKELSRPSDPVPIPTKLFSSPLARALATLDLTFKDVIPNDTNADDPAGNPLVVENLREALAPFTSDHRSSKSEIQKIYPAFRFEESFTENDPLWSESVSETDDEFNSRIKSTLDHIFKDLLEETDTYISITAHSGVTAMILQLVGHRNYSLPGGGVVPIVIKATFSD